MKINIITRCTRPHLLLKVQDSIFENKPEEIEIRWMVVYDTNPLKDIDVEVLSSLRSENHFIKGIEGDFGHGLLNQMIDKVNDGFIYFLDDDNVIHEDFYNTILKLVKENPDKKGFIFSQQVDGRDWSGVHVRIGKPENTKVQGIDMAQFLLYKDLLSLTRFDPMNYKADGIFIEKVYNENKDQFCFTTDILSHYNYLNRNSYSSSPKIICIAEGHPEMKSYTIAHWESNHLNIKYIKDDSEITKNINEFNPDGILSIGPTWESNPNLGRLPASIRRKWLHQEVVNSGTGESIYQCAMDQILDLNRSDLVSYFTPIYNTGDKLLLAYKSLKEQTYDNWEWVLVNDSTDGGKTLKIAEKLAEEDSRIKIYDFRTKSGGIVGESKYRAGMLCRGEILAEFDHDDYLMPECTEMLIKASNKYPEAGFFYSDCVEITSNWETPRFYGDGFAFGYGHYREEMHLGRKMNVAASFNINPKTIRHIVGVPNHVRAWRRSDYLKIGGHNRDLSIADDFELVIRTFLSTQMVRIPKLGYLQFIHNTGSNTHNLSRADIQRRVRTIGDYYNKKIYDRFTELGIEDWAYIGNPQNPLLTPSRFGDEEGKSNLIYED